MGADSVGAPELLHRSRRPVRVHSAPVPDMTVANSGSPFASFCLAGAQFSTTAGEEIRNRASFQEYFVRMWRVSNRVTVNADCDTP